MVASHADVTLFGVCHAFLPDIGEDCVISQKNVCLNWEARKMVADYAVYFVAVSSRTCQMSYNRYPMSVNVLPISLLVTGGKSAS